MIILGAQTMMPEMTPEMRWKNNTNTLRPKNLWLYTNLLEVETKSLFKSRLINAELMQIIIVNINI